MSSIGATCGWKPNVDKLRKTVLAQRDVYMASHGRVMRGLQDSQDTADTTGSADKKKKKRGRPLKASQTEAVSDSETEGTGAANLHLSGQGNNTGLDGWHHEAHLLCHELFGAMPQVRILLLLLLLLLLRCVLFLVYLMLLMVVILRDTPCGPCPARGGIVVTPLANIHHSCFSIPAE